MSEPVAYMYDGIRYDGSKHGPHLTWRIDTCDAMSASKGTTMIPLYLHPDPRVAELEVVLRECREAMQRAKYSGTPYTSSYNRAIAKIDEVLNGKE